MEKLKPVEITVTGSSAEDLKEKLKPYLNEGWVCSGEEVKYSMDWFNIRHSQKITRLDNTIKITK